MADGKRANQHERNQQSEDETNALYKHYLEDDERNNSPKRARKTEWKSRPTPQKGVPAEVPDFDQNKSAMIWLEKPSVKKKNKLAETEESKRKNDRRCSYCWIRLKVAQRRGSFAAGSEQFHPYNLCECSTIPNDDELDALKKAMDEARVEMIAENCVRSVTQGGKEFWVYDPGNTFVAIWLERCHAAYDKAWDYVKELKEKKKKAKEASRVKDTKSSSASTMIDQSATSNAPAAAKAQSPVAVGEQTATASTATSFDNQRSAISKIEVSAALGKDNAEHQFDIILNKLRQIQKEHQQIQKEHQQKQNELQKTITELQKTITELQKTITELQKTITEV
ncbi:hypothetical protein G7054_g12546 [Neopestalotiopsis clavispora]|nr:hypothetical protein G7054_g12546 [Neopestalotiopsis clavispora]